MHFLFSSYPHNSMRYILLWVILCASCISVNAQQNCTLSLSIRVSEPGAGEALPGAVLLLEGTAMQSVSDSDGIARFHGLCDSTYSIVIRYLGFRESRLEVRPGEAIVSVRLKSDARALRAAEVVAGKVTPVAVESVDSIGAAELVQSRGEGLTQILSRVAGVTAMQTGNNVAKPVIHGLHSQRVLILNAGIRQEGQQWGTEHAPEIDPLIAGRLTVIRGVSSLRYGSDALGGVILVEPRELPHDPGIHAELNLVGQSNGRQGLVSGMVEQHLGRLYDICWRLQGTLRQGGNIHTPDVYLDNTGVREHNWSGSVGLERKRGGGEVYFSSFNGTYGIFSGSHIGSLSDLQRIISEGLTLTSDRFSYRIEAPRQEVSHRLLSVRSWYAMPNIGKVSARYGYQFNRRFEFDRDKPFSVPADQAEKPELELNLYTQTADVTLETRSIKGFMLETGVSLMLQDNQYGGQRYFVPNYRLWNAGVHLLVRRRLTRSMEAEAGVRYDMREQSVFRNASGVVVQDDYEFQLPNYSAGLLYRPDSTTTLRLHAGTAKRAPSINEWFSNGLHHGTATYETGDPSLGTERAWTISTGVRINRSEFKLDAGLYYLHVSDYIYLSPANEPVLTVSGAFPSFDYRSVDAAFKGADLDLSWQASGRVGIRSRGSAVFAWNESDSRYLELIPAPRLEHSVVYALAGTRSRLDPEITFSVRNVFRQWRYTPGTDYMPPPAGYTLLNMEIAGTRKSPMGDIRFSLSVNNLLNTRYREYMNLLRYYSDEAGRNFVLRILVPLSFQTAPHDHPH